MLDIKLRNYEINSKNKNNKTAHHSKILKTEVASLYSSMGLSYLDSVKEYKACFNLAKDKSPNFHIEVDN